MLLPGVKWSISYNWQQDVLLTMEEDRQTDRHGRTHRDRHIHTHTHTPNKTSISSPTKFIGTKLKGQNKTHQDPHDKPTQ